LSTPQPNLPAATASAKPAAPTTDLPIPGTRPPEPVRARDPKASEGLPRPRHNNAPAPTPRPSPSAQATPKAGGLDAAEFPKPD
jgi:hypothetical protein